MTIPAIISNITFYHGTSSHAWNDSHDCGELYLTASLDDAMNYACEAAIIDEEAGRTIAPIIILIQPMAMSEMLDHVIIEPDWGWATGLEYEAKHSNTEFTPPTWEESLSVCHGICLDKFTSTDKSRLIVLPLNAINEIDLYHITLKDSLPSILENGLTPMIGLRSLSCKELEPAVFCFTSKESCEDAGWLMDQFQDDDELVIIKIAFSGQKIKSDVGYELAILEAIPPTAITMVFNDDWTENNEFVRGRGLASNGPSPT